jgi:2-methylaconitate cis-trans-isomerase PrpF
VFIEAKDVNVDGTILPDAVDNHPTLLAILDSIRRKGSVAMGLSKDEASAPNSIPKIAMISKSKPHQLLSGEDIQENKIDLVVRALSVGQPHRAIPITVAMAIAAAANLKGSTVYDNVSQERVEADDLTIGHSSGKIVVGAKFDDRGSLTHATLFRTARRLFDGMVYWK